MLIKKLLFCALSVGCIVYAESSVDSTQDPQTQDSMPEIHLKTFVLDKIISSSTGFDLSLGDEARNVVLIDKMDLEGKGFSSLQQALQAQPLLTFNNSGFGDNIDLRGQGEDANRAVKILVNRVPINLLDTSHGVPPYNNIDIEDIESIEIIPGGGAVVYGNGTRGGVINIVTKKYMEDFARVVLKATSGERVGLQGGSLSVAGGKRIDDSLFLRGDISGGYMPGVRNVKGASDKAFVNDNMTNLYTAGQALYEINGNHKLDFNINYSHIWANSPSGSSSTANYQYLHFNSNNNEIRYLSSPYTRRESIDSVMASLNYNAKFSDSIGFDALAFYQFSNISYDSYLYPLSSGTPFDQTDSGFENHGGG